MILQECVIALMFCSLGFFFSYFALRTINIALILLMVWASFKVIEKNGMHPDWTDFYKMKEMFLNLWRILIEMITSMLSNAPTLSITLFVAGGLTGFILNSVRRHQQ